MKSDKSKGRFRQAFTRGKDYTFYRQAGVLCGFVRLHRYNRGYCIFTSNKSPKPQVQDLADNDKVITLPEPTMPDGLDTAGLQDEKISIKIKDSTLPPEEDKVDEEALKETLATKEDKKEEEGKSEDQEKSQDDVKKEEAPKEEKKASKNRLPRLK